MTTRPLARAIGKRGLSDGRPESLTNEVQMTPQVAVLHSDEVRAASLELVGAELEVPLARLSLHSPCSAD